MLSSSLSIGVLAQPGRFREPTISRAIDSTPHLHYHCDAAGVMVSVSSCD